MHADCASKLFFGCGSIKETVYLPQSRLHDNNARMAGDWPTVSTVRMKLMLRRRCLPSIVPVAVARRAQHTVKIYIRNVS
jgi:hypothetical protein